MTPNFTDLRRYRRANVGPDHTIQFKAADRFFLGMPIITLGAGGCSVKLSLMHAGSLEVGMLLTKLYLVHPQIPKTPLQGKVSWIRSNQPGIGDDCVLVGIEFVEPDLEFVKSLDAYVMTFQAVPH